MVAKALIPSVAGDGAVSEEKRRRAKEDKVYPDWVKNR